MNEHELRRALAAIAGPKAPLEGLAAATSASEARATYRLISSARAAIQRAEARMEERLGLSLRVCAEDHELFLPARADQRYCSTRCRVAAYRRRKES